MEHLPELDNRPLKEPCIVETVVPGFRAAAASAGIKEPARDDLALIVADRPANAAGVFTQNPVTAAPVQVSREHLAGGKLRAIVANSGCANAATGQEGLDAALATCQAAAEAVGCAPGEVAPCSTGVIGQLLPADKVTAALPSLADDLSPEGLPAAARAIMSTDAFAKMAETTAEVGGRQVKVVGLAKGAGMIRPDMATMLAFVLTDAAASPTALRAAVVNAAAASFNRITVDGDTSTNDTLLLLASGAAKNPELGPASPDLPALADAVTKVCQDLAAMMVADGEGAGHLVRVVVSGCHQAAQAKRLAYAIAHSPLCKTAFTGCDPNWGRILSAAAAESQRRGYLFNPRRCALWIGDAQILEDGRYTSAQAEAEAAEVMQRHRYQVRLDLGLGGADHWVLTTDLTHEYININADYRS